MGLKEVSTILDVNNGAISDLFDNEYQKLLDNLADEQTNWNVARELTIKLKVKLTGEERASALTSVEVTTKLAPHKADERMIHLDSDGRHVSAYLFNEAKQPALDNIVEMEG